MSNVPNRKRSEIVLKIGKKEYNTKITLNVLEKIESEIDNNIFVTISKLGSRLLSFTDMLTIVQIAINEKNPSISREEIADELINSNFGDIYELVVNVLQPLLKDPDEDEEVEGESEGND